MLFPEIQNKNKNQINRKFAPHGLYGVLKYVYLTFSDERNIQNDDKFAKI